jgi:parvulin-like peptidyl-prolyl isomerase
MSRSGWPLFLVAAMLFSGAAGCVESASRRVVARAGNRAITVAEYQEALKRLMPPGDAASEDEIRELKRDLINQLIEEELMIEEAGRSGAVVTDDEVSFEAEGIRKEYGDEAFRDAIVERYGDMDRWKEEIRRKLIVRKVVDGVTASVPGPTEDEARAYYAGHAADYEVAERVRARMIVVGTEDEARRARGRLKTEGFAKVAREVSLSPEKGTGGDLGFFSRGDMPVEFEDVVFRLGPGEISGVVKTEYGFHIFLVEERKRGGRLAFGEVRERIVENMRAERAEKAVAAWMAELKRNAGVVVNEELL